MLVKSLVGSLAARIALGAGVAAASVTAAGAAGVLPGPAQDAVATVVAATTPFQLPEPGVSLQVGDVPSSSTSTSTTVAGADEDEGEGEARKINHGACVSTVAGDKSESEGESHGKTVSSIARSDCGKTSTTVAGSSTTSSSTTSTTVASGERSGNSGPGSSNRGQGNSGNSGNSNGNSGSGNSGKN